MGSRSGSRGVSINPQGLRELDAFLRDQIAREDLNPAKRDLRQGTKAIANAELIPVLQQAADASGVPIAPAMARTARTRTDRIVTVRIGAVNPRGLRGFRSGRGQAKAGSSGYRTRNSQSDRTTLAYGSDRGPHPSNKVSNPYGVSRNEAGYWVAPGVAAAFDRVKRAYVDLLGQIMRDYGRYR